MYRARGVKPSIGHYMLLGILFVSILYGSFEVSYMRYFHGFVVSVDTGSDQTNNSDDKDDSLLVFYANIYKKNTDYIGLIDTIKKQSADVVVLVEYGDGHHNAMSGFFDTNYPYNNIAYIDVALGGNVIFSRYPIDDDALLIDQTTRKYGYATIRHNNTKYVFYVIHTAAPVDPRFFYQRNIQLEEISSLVLSRREADNPDTVVIMVGDYNVSPRSIYYKRFLDQGLGYYKKIYNRSMLLNTRCVDYNVLGFPCTEIDHLFTSHPSYIQSLKTLHIPGSDHDGIIFDLQ